MSKRRENAAVSASGLSRACALRRLGLALGKDIDFGNPMWRHVRALGSDQRHIRR
jgi:hypothetical protein